MGGSGEKKTYRTVIPFLSNGADTSKFSESVFTFRLFSAWLCFGLLCRKRRRRIRTGAFRYGHRQFRHRILRFSRKTLDHGEVPCGDTACGYLCDRRVCDPYGVFLSWVFPVLRRGRRHCRHAGTPDRYSAYHLRSRCVADSAEPVSIAIGWVFSVREAAGRISRKKLLLQQPESTISFVCVRHMYFDCRGRRMCAGAAAAFQDILTEREGIVHGGRHLPGTI